MRRIPLMSAILVPLLVLALMTGCGGKSKSPTAPTVPTAPAYHIVAMWGRDGNTGTYTARFGTPSGIALDASGNVYVTDDAYWHRSYNHMIHKFTRTGVFITAWGDSGTGNGQLQATAGIAVDGGGNVYVEDVNAVRNLSRVQKFASGGTYLSQWGTFGSASGQLRMPAGMAADGANVYVVDSGNHRIQKFSSSGAFITAWGDSGIGTGQFGYPWGAAVDGSGNVYVADAVQNRVQKFTSSGVYLAQWGTHGAGRGQFGEPRGVAVDAGGNVYVADAGNHRVQKFTGAGAFVAAWGDSGSGWGQLMLPGAVAVDDSGNVYIADTATGLISKYAPGR